MSAWLSDAAGPASASIASTDHTFAGAPPAEGPAADFAPDVVGAAESGSKPGRSWPPRQLDSRLLQRPAMHGPVLKGSTLQALSTAREVVEAAEREAAALVEAGLKEGTRVADELLQSRQAELARRESQLATEMWQRMARFSEAVSRDWDLALGRLEDQAHLLVSDALARLTAEQPHEARVRACVRELARQGVRPDAGVLHVSAEDAEIVAAITALEGVPWPVEVDADLRAGFLRLASANGRWELDVEGTLTDLRNALESPQAAAFPGAAPPSDG
ncbi:hypothetical protein OU995_07765 [Roseateles sp. SL47]|uniref:HrpE/YscL family type III secretion apparatus protein n=1 Tax=Roseateles sp. SL47 TaxID=2995138 RepID=UPI002270197A|nr:HrpE/YscL family type III secretion apparatus protein [Roseateles sp. SL47]WAC74592.1 hypothetical protein OU995_07765 [Roseateles sp. SL47]